MPHADHYDTWERSREGFPTSTRHGRITVALASARAVLNNRTEEHRMDEYQAEMYREEADNLRKERRERGECPLCGRAGTHRPQCPDYNPALDYAGPDTIEEGRYER